MIFALLTLVAALALAAVAGWFSIIGLMAILAGQPVAALVLGATLELGKLVTTSWLYRNWGEASWKLKGPLIYFTFALMLATSMGVFGFLSKAHLEQGAPTMDNTSKIERITQQIDREKALIADNDKVIQQLDSTVNSFLGKDRADRALSVRKSQSAQRKQLKDDSDATQKRIESLNDEKFKLESDLRKLQLEVGPIRYIAELIYGSEKSDNKTLESAVRIFTLIIVSTLDPLAITLLIAANFTLLRLQNEKEKDRKVQKSTLWFSRKTKSDGDPDEGHPEMGLSSIQKIKEEAYSEPIRQNDIAPHEVQETAVVVPILPEMVEDRVNETIEEILEEAARPGGSGDTGKDEQIASSVGPVLVEPIQIRIREDDKPEHEIHEIEVQEVNEEENPTLEDLQGFPQAPLPRIHQPAPSRVSIPYNDTPDRTTSTAIYDNTAAPIPVQISPRKSVVIPWASQSATIREILGFPAHFIPQKLNEEEIKEEVASQTTEADSPESSPTREAFPAQEMDIKVEKSSMAKVELPKLTSTAGFLAETHKYPKALSWVNEFKRS